MDIIETMKRRRSCRAFDAERPVPREILESVAEAGRLAPSAHNLQPRRFLFVTDRDMLKRITACYKSRWIDSAPHILVVIASREDSWVREDGYCSVETDATIAMDHMILAAESFGLATCWVAAFSEAELRKVLRLKAHEYVYAITPLGYALNPQDLQNRQPVRKALEELAEFI